MPILSVITSVYNRGQIVDLTLRSILKTEATDFEIVLLDDGGTDNIGFIVQDINKMYGDKIKLLRLEKNTASPSKARNFGFKNSTGKYVAFVDCDFIHLCDPIQQTREYFAQPGRDNDCLISGNWFLVRKDFGGKAGWWLDVPPSVTNKAQTIPWAAWLAIHRKHYEEIGGCDEKYGYRGEDQKLNTCLHRKGLNFVKNPHLIAIHQYYKEKGYKMPDPKQMEWQMKDHKYFTRWKVNEGIDWGRG